MDQLHVSERGTALALGATTAIFSMVDGIMLRALPTVIGVMPADFRAPAFLGTDHQPGRRARPSRPSN